MMWSTVIVADTVLLLELLPGNGIPLYFADPAGASAFLGARWTKGLRFTAERWRHTIAGLDAPCTPSLGRVVRYSESAITWRRGPRDPDVLHQHAPQLAALADALAVERADLGVCGSALYKPATCRGDFDFIVFERDEHSPAWPATRRLASGCEIDGVPYHLRFQLAGDNCWYDPHFTGSCGLSEAIITDHAQPAGTAPLCDEVVVGAAHGHHTPAHYELHSGHHLLSFRFGHSGLFQPGDRLTTDRALQLATWGGVTSFVVSDGDQQVEVWRP